MPIRQTILWRQPDFRDFWTGWSVSQLGSQVTFFALQLVALRLLGASAFQVGVLAALGYAAWLVVGLPAGVWVDRIQRRPLLIAADVGRALLIGSVPVTAVMGWLTLEQLYVVAALTGVLTVLFDIAEPAYLPSLVPQDDIVRANGLLQASRSTATVGGPALAGLLVRAFGAPVALVGDAVSYVVSAGFLMRIRVREVVPVRTKRHLRRELGEGLLLVYADPLLRTLAVAAALANFLFAGTEALLIVFLDRTVGVSAGVIGLLLAVGGVGGLVGGLVSGPLAGRMGAGRALLVAVTAMLPARLLLPLTGTGALLLVFVAGVFVFGVSVVVFNVNVASFIQTAAPSNLLGRVIASIRFLSRGVLPAGALAGGALGSWIGVRPALWTLAAAMSLILLWLLTSPLRTMRDLPAAVEPR